MNISSTLSGLIKKQYFLIIISHKPLSISCPSTADHSDQTHIMLRHLRNSTGSPQQPGGLTQKGYKFLATETAGARHKSNFLTIYKTLAFMTHNAVWDFFITYWSLKKTRSHMCPHGQWYLQWAANPSWQGPGGAWRVWRGPPQEEGAPLDSGAAYSPVGDAADTKIKEKMIWLFFLIKKTKTTHTHTPGSSEFQSFHKWQYLVTDFCEAQEGSNKDISFFINSSFTVCSKSLLLLLQDRLGHRGPRVMIHQWRVHTLDKGVGDPSQH